MERALVALAARQHGVLSAPQLRDAGLSRDVALDRARRGVLIPVHRGVYRVGPTEAPLARAVAALLACGPDAVVSHLAAAVVQGIRPELPATIDVTVARGQRRSRRGIRVHRAVLPDEEVVVVDGIRVTAPARTLLDVAAHVPRRELERLTEEAMIRRLVDSDALAAAGAAHPGRRGAAALRRILGDLADPALTRSEAERRLLELVRAADLPRPATNVRLGRYEVDLLWGEQRLVVEMDGFAFHGSRAAFERDRRRDADLVAAGYRVVRVTWRQIVREPEALVARLAVLLTTSHSASGPERV